MEARVRGAPGRSATSSRRAGACRAPGGGGARRAAPSGARPPPPRRELQDWLLRAWDQFGRTVLFITHDVAEALYLGDRVIVLSPRPGQVARDLAVDLPGPRRPSMPGHPGV